MTKKVSKEEVIEVVPTQIKLVSVDYGREDINDLIRLARGTRRRTPATLKFVTRLVAEVLEELKHELPTYRVRLGGGTLVQVDRTIADLVEDLHDYPAMKEP